MAISLTTLTGPVYMPNGATPYGGKVTFELTSWDREQGEAVFVSGPYHADIDENGHFEVELFTTTEGTNSVNYRMYVHWFDSKGAGEYTNQAFNSHGTNNYIKEYIGSFALSGEGPYSVSDINIVSELTANSFDVLLECSSFVDMAKIEAEKAETATETVQTFIDTYSEVSDFNAAVDVILSPEKDRILELENSKDSFINRDATNSAVIVALGNGKIGYMAGLPYLVDTNATGSDSVTNDLGEDGLVAHGEVFVEHFGDVGSSDDGAVINRALSSGKSITFSRPSGYQVSTKLVDNGDETRTFKNGSKIIYAGANTPSSENDRLLDVTGKSIWLDPVFDGQNKQPWYALVNWAAGSGPTFWGGETKNILASVHGFNGTNNCYGLWIDTDNVRDFAVKTHKFTNIKSHNDTATITTPTEGWGFCGGILVGPGPDLNPSTAYTAFSVGEISDCEFTDIQTIRDTGLSVAQYTTFDDADGIRLYGTMLHPDCDIAIQRNTFTDCSKRGIKSAIKGVRILDTRIICTSNLPYPMPTAIKLNNDNTCLRTKVECRAEARQVGSAVQLALQSNGNLDVEVDGFDVDYCRILVETIAGAGLAVWENIEFKNFQCENVSLRVLTETPGSATNDSGVWVDNFKVKGFGNSCIFSQIGSGWDFGTLDLENMSFKVPSGSRADNVKLRLNNSAFVGNGSAMLCEVGGTVGCRVGKLEIDVRGYGTGAPPNNTRFMFFGGSDTQVDHLHFITDDNVYSTNYLCTVQGDGVSFGDITWNCPATFAIGTVTTTDAVSIGTFSRVGSGASSTTAVMIGGALMGKCGIGSVIDMRASTAPPVRLLPSSGKCGIGSIVANKASGLSQDDTGGNLTVGNSIALG